MTQLSNSNINAVADLKPGYTLGAADVALLQEMARRLLAAEEREPSHLAEFYAKYQQWLLAGADSPEFTRDAGLCANLYDWCVSNQIVPETLLVQLHADFERYGMDAVLPFNTDAAHYDDEKNAGTCHENAARRLWVNFMLDSAPQPVAVPDKECTCPSGDGSLRWPCPAHPPSSGAVQLPDDTKRMDWLVSKTVNVREPMVYGSHSLFWSQAITDENDEYHATKLREQIDAAMAEEQAAAPQEPTK